MNSIILQHIPALFSQLLMHILRAVYLGSISKLWMLTYIRDQGQDRCIKWGRWGKVLSGCHGNHVADWSYAISVVLRSHGSVTCPPPHLDL